MNPTNDEIIKKLLESNLFNDSYNRQNFDDYNYEKTETIFYPNWETLEKHNDETNWQKWCGQEGILYSIHVDWENTITQYYCGKETSSITEEDGNEILIFFDKETLNIVETEWQ